VVCLLAEPRHETNIPSPAVNFSGSACNYGERGDNLRQVQSDSDTIGRLYGQHAGELYHYLVRRCPDAATAGDLLQETFLQVVRQSDQLEKVAMPRAWLFAIARNMLARHYRRQRDPQPVAWLWYEVDEDKDERLAVMREAMSSLSAELRDTLQLRLEQELSYEEIAHVLDVPVGTVRSRLHNAVRQLRDLMNQQEETKQ
jgi:RNA polymerase sigma-70 factor (ECF subfamily)